MEVQIKKWGNSASVRLPSGVMKQLGLQPDDFLEIYHDDGVLVLKPIKLSLSKLVDRICDDNVHGALWDDNAVGLETL